MTYAHTLRGELARASADLNAIVAIAKKENRGLTNEETEKFDKLEAHYSGLEESIKRAEKAESIESALGKEASSQITNIFTDKGVGKFEDTTRRDLHSRAFANYLRYGINELSNEEKNFLGGMYRPNFEGQQIRNTMSTTTGSQGGYVVPSGFSDQLEIALKYFGGIVGEVTTWNTETGNPVPWPTMNDTNNMGRIIGQNTQVTENDVSFGQVTFNAWIFSSDLVLMPYALLQDSYFDLQGVIATALGQRIGRLLNNKGTVGAGSGSGEPTGLVTAAVAAGLIYTAATGETTSVIYDDIVNLEHTVDPMYRPNAKYMFHDSTLKVLKKLKDSTGRPLWLPQAESGMAPSPARGTINGYPYVINMDMPAMAANANSILFGDLSKYKLRRVAAPPSSVLPPGSSEPTSGVTLMRLSERYADFLQQGFIGFMRCDGNLIDAGTHPIAVFRNSAT